MTTSSIKKPVCNDGLPNSIVSLLRLLMHFVKIVLNLLVFLFIDISSNIDVVRVITLQDLQVTSEEIKVSVCISQSSIRWILNEYLFKRKFALDPTVISNRWKQAPVNGFETNDRCTVAFVILISNGHFCML